MATLWQPLQNAYRFLNQAKAILANPEQDTGQHVREGLFQCSDLAGLPRTNNGLEHCFGVARVHERRATGRRGAILGVFH